MLVYTGHAPAQPERQQQQRRGPRSAPAAPGTLPRRLHLLHVRTPPAPTQAPRFDSVAGAPAAAGLRDAAAAPPAPAAPPPSAPARPPAPPPPPLPAAAAAARRAARPHGRAEVPRGSRHRGGERPRPGRGAAPAAAPGLGRVAPLQRAVHQVRPRRHRHSLTAVTSRGMGAVPQTAPPAEAAAGEDAAAAAGHLQGGAVRRRRHRRGRGSRHHLTRHHPLGAALADLRVHPRAAAADNLPSDVRSPPPHDRRTRRPHRCATSYSTKCFCFRATVDWTRPGLFDYMLRLFCL
ncbi:atherin-like [Schistocerca americana]|uniref:atherin-like n=1 Tax=Schistocerca americana TaxID=7009 RepID=UPI001F5024F0|nr:atherin-like [Schistocerca americana]